MNETTITTRLESVRDDIAATELAIRPLAEKLEALKRESRELESKLFIAVNKIRREDVELSSEAGKPWFGTVLEFGSWLRQWAITKPWAEWNGRIYRASDLKASRMPDMPARVSDLE